MNTSSNKTALRGSASIFFSASIFGLFWIPLHYFDRSGVVALWAVAAINIAAGLIAIPLALWHRQVTRHHLGALIIIGLGMGISNVLYFAGIILSDVVRVIFLFYLLPLWATLFSWLIFSIPIGRARMVAMAIAFIGIWLLLGAGSWPIPQNLGDVFGLLSGAGWAFGLTMIRGKEDLGAFATTASSLVFATLCALLIGIIMRVTVPDIQPAAPDFETVFKILPAILAFGIIILWPSLFGQLWGAQYVAATTAALLTMSEIMAATVSTALLGTSDLPLISWFGAGLILCAILIDILAGQDA